MIRLENLHFGYDGFRLGPLDIKFEAGKLNLLVGKNGSGKSTLLKSMLGFIPISEGKILLDNTDITKIPGANRAEAIAYVASKNYAVPHLSVAQLISIQPVHKKISSQDVNDALTTLGMQNFKHRLLNTLSDGELQKVYIARAIAQQTKYIILDEPASHLDVNARLETFLILKQLASEKNIGIICSSHDVELGLRICDQMLLIDKKKFFSGAPEDLVLNKTISQTFNSSEVAFDPLNGTFKFCLSMQSKLKVYASEEVYPWVESALHRIGIMSERQETLDTAELKVNYPTLRFENREFKSILEFTNWWKNEK